MSSLPEEIYLDILLRVPVKSTFVCKCVCKKWYALISDPDFVKMHLDLTKQRNNCSLLVQSINTFLSYDSLLSSSSNESDYDAADVVALDCPYKYPRRWEKKIILLGSCNGIVCGWDDQLYYYFLWNPTTKEYKKLPKPLDPYYVSAAGYYGFGYDCKTDDYKFVTIERSKGSNVVLVYSLNSNTWKSLPKMQYEFPYTEMSAAVVNGALHWYADIIGGASSTLIVSIDISEERYGELQLPTVLETSDQYYMDMGVLEGSLCVLVRSKETFQVWVMQTYGVPDSWTKLYTITYESISCYPWCYVELIGSFKNGEILFKESDNVVAYNSKYGTGRKTEIDYIDMMDEGGTVKYFESLVSLKSNTFVGKRKKRKVTHILMEIRMKKRNREHARA